MSKVEKEIELIVGPSSLTEFVEWAIDYQARSADGFRDWLTENFDLDEDYEMKRYSRSSLSIVEERLRRLRLAESQLRLGYGLDLAERELEEEILLHENVINVLAESGVSSTDEHLVFTNLTLISLQMLQDDLKGVKRENYGIELPGLVGILT